MSTNSVIARDIDGRKLSREVLERCAKGSERLRQKSVIPHLAAILVGEASASKIYVANELKACATAGIRSSLFEMPVAVSESDILHILEQLNRDTTVHGILVQLPLPRHIDVASILAAIAPHKDVDGFHFYNVGSLVYGVPTFARFCDGQLGRLLDWWDAKGASEGFQIILLSDHGHITEHSRVSINAVLSELGFSTGPAPADGVDAVVVSGQVGAIYLADRSTGTLIRVVDAFTSQPWCGNLFTPIGGVVEGRVEGTFNAGLVLAAHERVPDLYFCYRTDDRVDSFGLTGGTWYDSDWPAGLGLYGGLRPKELGAVGIVAGSEFKSGMVSETRTGIADLLPTMLTVMGVPVPDTVIAH